MCLLFDILLPISFVRNHTWTCLESGEQVTSDCTRPMEVEQLSGLLERGARCGASELPGVAAQNQSLSGREVWGLEKTAAPTHSQSTRMSGAPGNCGPRHCPCQLANFSSERAVALDQGTDAGELFPTGHGLVRASARRLHPMALDDRLLRELCRKYSIWRHSTWRVS